MIKRGLTKFKTPLEELEVMAGFQDTTQYAVIKAWAKRYISNLKNVSFGLLEHDPAMKYKHAEYAGQALGLTQLLRFIEGVSKEINKLEKKNEPK